MKLILIPYLPSAVRAYPMARYFVKANNEVHLILWNMPYPITPENIWNNIRNSLKYRRYTREGVVIHKIRRLPFFFPPINTWLFKNQIRNIFNEFDVDLIISETFFNETEPPLDLPILYDMSDDHEAFPEIYGSSIYKLAYKILQAHKTIKNQIIRSKFVMAVSENLVEYAKEYRTDNIYKIPNGVEGWVINEKYKRGVKHSLIYVTNFGKWSEVNRLLYAIYELKRKYADIKLSLIGDGPEIPEAKKIAKRLKLDKNVNFLGKISNRSKLFEEINKHEICLNISEKNKFRDSASPMKVFEYSALGKKIVSTNLHEVKRLNFSNILFYTEDGEGKNMIKTIQKAFDLEIDINKVRDAVKNYGWDKIIEKILGIIDYTILGEEHK